MVANQTATSPTLIGERQARADRGPVQFHLVVPALNSHLRHWLSDTDDAVSAARRRDDRALSVLKSYGLSVSVEVGDSVLLRAIGDALSHFGNVTTLFVSNALNGGAVKGKKVIANSTVLRIRLQSSHSQAPKVLG